MLPKEVLVALGILESKMRYVVLVVFVFLSSCSVIRLNSKKENQLSSEDSSAAYNFAFTEATKQKLFGNYSRALSLLFKCVEVNPYSSASYYLISEIYLKNGDEEKALEYCRLAVKYDPKNNWFRLDLATLYKMNNKIDSAINQYKYLVKKNDDNLKYKYNLAALYFEYGDLDKSLKIIRDLIDVDKKNEELAITKFQLERKLQRYKSAENTLKRIFRKRPAEYRFLGLLAEHYKSIGKFKKVEKAYKSLLAKDSLNEIGILGLSSFYFEIKRSSEAESLIKKRLLNSKDLSEEEVQFLINSLKVKSLPDSFKLEVVNRIKNWFTNNLDNEIDLKSMADIFVNAGYTKDATELIEYLYHNKSEFARVDLYLMLLNLQDRNSEILKITSDSLAAGGSAEYLFYYNGIGYYKQKMYKEAAESFEKGLSFLSEERTYEEQFLTLLGESYYRLNNIQTSFQYFEKVLEINPYNLYVLNNYSYYLAIMNLSLDKAEEMSKKCIMLDRRNFNYLDTYAWILFKKGKYQQAYESLKRALEIGGNADQNLVNHYKELLKVMNLKN